MLRHRRPYTHKQAMKLFLQTCSVLCVATTDRLVGDWEHTYSLQLYWLKGKASLHLNRDEFVVLLLSIQTCLQLTIAVHVCTHADFPSSYCESGNGVNLDKGTHETVELCPMSQVQMMRVVYNYMWFVHQGISFTRAERSEVTNAQIVPLCHIDQCWVYTP